MGNMAGAKVDLAKIRSTLTASPLLGFRLTVIEDKDGSRTAAAKLGGAKIGDGKDDS
jgi:hypothetical protein